MNKCVLLANKHSTSNSIQMPFERGVVSIRSRRERKNVRCFGLLEGKLQAVTVRIFILDAHQFLDDVLPLFTFITVTAPR